MDVRGIFGVLVGLIGWTPAVSKSRQPNPSYFREGTMPQSQDVGEPFFHGESGGEVPPPDREPSVGTHGANALAATKMKSAIITNGPPIMIGFYDWKK